MGSLDTFLKRALIIGSVLVIVVLSGVAIYSAGNASTGNPEAADESVPDEDIASPQGRIVPGQRLQVQDGLTPLSIGCVPSADQNGRDDARYVIVIQNQGETDSAYTVAVTLVDDNGRSEDTVINIPTLVPSQEVEAAVSTSGESGTVESCSVTAVETDRRVVLFD